MLNVRSALRPLSMYKSPAIKTRFEDLTWYIYLPDILNYSLLVVQLTNKPIFIMCAATAIICNTPPQSYISGKTKAVPNSHKCQLQYRSRKTQIGDPLFGSWPLLPVRETAVQCSAVQCSAVQCSAVEEGVG